MFPLKASLHIHLADYCVAVGFFFLLLLLLFCCLFHPHEQKISVCSLRACCVLLFFILSFSDFYLLGLNHLVVSLSISSLLETGEPPCTKTGFPLGCPFLGSLLCPVYALHLFFSDFASCKSYCVRTSRYLNTLYFVSNQI